jgi:hypothetical protein
VSATVKLSIGESEALARKALRGVGCDWGLSEEGAFAVGLLCERGVPALRALVVLTQAYNAADSASACVCCPLTLGIRIMDGVDAIETLAGLAHTSVVAPVLLLPFVARALDDAAETAVLHWKTGPVRVAPGLDMDRAAVRLLADVSTDVLTDCTRTAPLKGLADAQPQSQRAEVWPACHATLEAFAHRTYVPASEYSRASGAGGAGPDD